MIGVLIFTHGHLCDVLRDEAERLSGHRELVRWVAMEEEETHDELLARVSGVVEELNAGEGVLALVDVVGGTPWNICGEIGQQTELSVRRIGGGGMPLFIKALQDHGEHHDLDAWATELAEYAHARLKAG